MNQKDKFYIPLIITLSVIIPLAVAGLMLLPDDLRLSFGGADLRSLPFFHAVLNGSTAVLLLVGFVWIKNKNCLTYCYDECIYLIGGIFGVLCDFKSCQMHQRLMVVKAG